MSPLPALVQERGYQGGDCSIQGGAGLRSFRRVHGDVQQTQPEPGGPRHPGGTELDQRSGKEGRGSEAAVDKVALPIRKLPFPELELNPEVFC